MTESVFDKIRAESKIVSSIARWVRIDHSKIAAYSDVLKLDELPSLAHTEEHHLLNAGDTTVAYFLILDSINFGSGYFPFIAKLPGASGYFTMAFHLKEWILQFGLPSPDYLRTISPADCAKVFQQPLASPHANELMELFAAALNHLGDWIFREFDGEYMGVFSREKTAEGVITALMEMPFFRDVAEYRGRAVPFLKRAQILIQDVTVADPSHPRLQFPDVAQLTIFADNVLAYVLKADGILQYDPWLEERIQREELIGSGSTEETEIRACTVHAVELLCKRINESLPMTIRELDFHLWNRGQYLKTKVADHRHRTRSVYY